MNGFDYELDDDTTQIVASWLVALNAALQADDAARLVALFRADADWRDVVALTGTIETVGDRAEIGRRLGAAAVASGARGFAIDPERGLPRDVRRGGESCIEAILRFETRLGRGAGVLRLKRADCQGRLAALTSSLFSPPA